MMDDDVETRSIPKSIVAAVVVVAAVVTDMELMKPKLD